VFEHRYHPGEAPLPTDEATTAMYRLTQATLTAAGYDHYEISNYARPGYHCRHNRVYWENRPYYGFGMGATSYTCHQRFSRPRTTDTYRVWVEDYVARGGQIDCTPTPRQEQWLDQLMVGLRLRTGVDLRALAATYGTAAVAELRALLTPEIHKGWVVIDPIPAPRLRLTDPEGFLFSNQVLVKLFDRWGG
jgi:coproporphyrinogen III oxidase-like Fe-S oxidoreductase